MIYIQRYVNTNIVNPTKFQVVDGQLKTNLFGREEFRFLSLIVTTLTDYTYDGKHINFPLMYYVDSLVMTT